MTTLRESARHLRLKKRFSQNFLVDESVLNRIVDCVDPSPADHVVEIGAGAGFLTERLLPRAGYLTAVELERRMVAYLTEKFQGVPGLTLVAEDILRFNFDTIAAPSFKVVGNLPYAITSKILFRLAGELEQTDYPLRQRIESCVLMVQKEVGERIAAEPGTKAYNALSIGLQFWFETRLAFVVPANAFYPAPKVTSAVVVLTPRAQPAASVQDLRLFSRLVHAAFSHRRKTLWNSLKSASFGNPDHVEAALTAVGLDKVCRADTLSIQTFADLSHAYQRLS